MKKSTLGYYEVTKLSLSFHQILKDAKKQGYNYMFRWINSSNEWCFFQTTEKKAENGAIDLYMKEKKEKNREIAKKCYSDKIDIVSVKELLKNE